MTANPLAGFEDRPFHEAVAAAEELLGGRGYPSANVFRRAREAGRIDPDRLRTELSAHGYDADPEASLDRMAAAESVETTDGADATATAADRVDAVLAKWLSAFLDEGQAEWSMPDREQGFYAAFRAVAPHDGEIPDAGAVADLPDSPSTQSATVSPATPSASGGTSSSSSSPRCPAGPASSSSAPTTAAPGSRPTRSRFRATWRCA